MEDMSSGKAKQLNKTQRKRNSDDPDQPKATCRKRRALSGFNLWHSQYMQSVGSQQFSSLAEKNKQSALQWRSLTDEEKERYCHDAAAHNCGDAIVNHKKEADKIIRHLVDTGEHADVLEDFHFMYVVVHNGKHYVGGSTSGCDFLRDQGSHIPYSFIGHLSAKSVPRPKKEGTGDAKDLLRKEVTKIFNECYAQHVKDPNARMPYSKIKEYGIRMEGLPSGIALKNPTSYGKTMLQDIIAKKDTLKLHVEKKLCIQEPAGNSKST